MAYNSMHEFSKDPIYSMPNVAAACCKEGNTVVKYVKIICCMMLMHAAR